MTEDDHLSRPEWPISAEGWRERKRLGRHVAALTAYDYPTARWLDEAGVDVLLVGDSLGMVVLGYPDTTHVTMSDMLRHTGAVARGASRALVVADLPYGACNSPADTVRHARELIAVGAHAVKLEGGAAAEPQLCALAEAGVPFVGHIGMLPQKVVEEGGYKRKGRSPEQAAALWADAKVGAQNGALAVVLEAVVANVARGITGSIDIPTIGIGSGADTDGQILVTPDLVGAFPWFTPPFAVTLGNVAEVVYTSARTWVRAVHEGRPLRP